MSFASVFSQLPRSWKVALMLYTKSAYPTTRRPFAEDRSRCLAAVGAQISPPPPVAFRGAVPHFEAARPLRPRISGRGGKTIFYRLL